MDLQNIQTLDVKPKEIGKKLIKLREERHLSQVDVADALGFERRRIWQFEQGVALTLENIAKLAFFYEKPIEYFIQEN